MKRTLQIMSLVLLVAPVAVAAAPSGNPAIQDFLEGTLTNIINVVIRFLLAVATLIFVGGVVYYISLGGQTEKLEEAKRFILFSLIGLVLIIIVWGLVNIIIDSLYLNTNVPKPPQIGGTGYNN